jgi:hypothetical protein
MSNLSESVSFMDGFVRIPNTQIKNLTSKKRFYKIVKNKMLNLSESESVLLWMDLLVNLKHKLIILEVKNRIR